MAGTASRGTLDGDFIKPGGAMIPPHRFGTTTQLASCAFGWITARRFTSSYLRRRVRRDSDEGNFFRCPPRGGDNPRSVGGVLLHALLVDDVTDRDGLDDAVAHVGHDAGGALAEPDRGGSALAIHLGSLYHAEDAVHVEPVVTVEHRPADEFAQINGLRRKIEPLFVGTVEVEPAYRSAG